MVGREGIKATLKRFRPEGQYPERVAEPPSFLRAHDIKSRPPGD